MRNIQHRTVNVERRSIFGARTANRCALKIVFSLSLWGPVVLLAQVPVQIPTAAQAQFQVPQPPVDVSQAEAVTATSAFDPAKVGVGQKTFYHVNVAAPESSVTLPLEIPAPKELKLGQPAHGQITRLDGNKFRPLTAYAFEMQATAAGHFTVSNFTVNVAGQTVEVPAASVEVVADNAGAPPSRRLILETSATNLFLGQPIRARVIWPVDSGNQIEALREVQFNGGGWLADKLATRQSVEPVNQGGQLKTAFMKTAFMKTAFIYETVLTPLAVGSRTISAQAFTAGRDFGGPIAISGQVTISGGAPKYEFLVSEPLGIKVLPLPREKELAGFTGAMGKFLADAPQLSTNRVRVGEPLQLKFGFHGEGNLTRLAPPEPPRSRDWQIIASKPSGSGFTLIPLTDEVSTTPAIPFSSFDPETGTYVDLTIPPLPVTVMGEGLPVELRSFDEQNPAPLKLSGLADAPGKTVSGLRPLQLRSWFVAFQFVPVIGLLALWQWDRRRRFLEAHPEIVRRRQAKRALRREKIKLQSAANAGDAATFVRRAADAMRIAVAPHFPAQPQALVCGDVLSQFTAADLGGQTGETVRKIFAAADARFALAPQVQADLLALKPEVERVLQQLEEKL